LLLGRSQRRRGRARAVHSVDAGGGNCPLSAPTGRLEAPRARRRRPGPAGPAAGRRAPGLTRGPGAADCDRQLTPPEPLDPRRLFLAGEPGTDTACRRRRVSTISSAMLPPAGS